MNGTSKKELSKAIFGETRTLTNMNTGEVIHLKHGPSQKRPSEIKDERIRRNMRNVC